MTSALGIAQRDLQLEKIAVVYPGEQRYRLADGIEAVPITDVAGGMETLFG
jgi:hypothetical protein